MLPDFDRDFVATYLRPQRPRLVLLAVLLFVGDRPAARQPRSSLGTFIDRAQAGAPSTRSSASRRRSSWSRCSRRSRRVAETYVAEDLGWRTTNALRVDLTRHVLALDDSFHAEHGAG